MSYDYQNNKRKNGNVETESESTVIEENLILQGKGNVFDPRLMSYMALLGLGLNQQEFESNTNSGNSSGDLKSYGLRMNFLPLKPYPFSIDTSRTDSLLSRSFQGPLRVKNSNDGFVLRLRVPEWPMTFSYNKSAIEQDSDFIFEDYFRRESEKFSYTLQHDLNEHSNLTFRSDIDSLTQTSSQQINQIDTQRHRLQHYLHFGTNNANRLESSLLYHERVDTFKSSTFEWNENLILQHSDSFSTYYNTIFTETTINSIDSTMISGTTGFKHRIFDNLLTNFNVFASQSDFGSNNSTDIIGGRVNFDYYRNNPWGIFFAELSLDSFEQKSTGETGTAIASETETFNDPLSFFLDNRNVNLDTITIRNQAGTEFYTEGDDYTVTEVGDRVEISPTIFGSVGDNITDGQILVIDYTYSIEGDRTEDYNGRYFKLQQDFKNGISVYFSNRTYDRNINSSVDLNAADESSETAVYGAKYTNDRLTLIAEHTDTDSTFQSTKSDRIAATAYWPLTPRTSLIGTVSQTWITAEGQNARETEVFKTEAKVKTRLSKNLRLSGKAEYRDENSTDIGKTEGIRFGTFLDYNRALLNVRAEWNFYSLDRSSNHTDTTGFYIKVTRRF